MATNEIDFDELEPLNWLGGKIRGQKQGPNRLAKWLLPLFLDNMFEIEFESGQYVRRKRFLGRGGSRSIFIFLRDSDGLFFPVILLVVNGNIGGGSWEGKVFCSLPALFELSFGGYFLFDCFVLLLMDAQQQELEFYVEI